MKLGVYLPSKVPLSVRSYVTHVLAGLPDVEVVRFAPGDPLPDADLIWDPSLSGGKAPSHRRVDKPFVFTLHGASPFALPAKDVYRSWRGALLGNLRKLVYRLLWRRWVDAPVITVSRFAQREVEAIFGLRNVTVIYHGVDHAVFRPADGSPGDYLLHVSAYRSVKNVRRLFEAYRDLPTPKPRLMAVVPHFPLDKTFTNVEIVRDSYSHAQLAVLYQNALAFAFPSLRESFGMPIIEAMACGCPVITSNTSACAEIADSAALLVDPRSVEDIAAAMQRLIDDASLRHSLRQRGIQRAAQFSWETCAQEHRRVFERVAGS